MDKTQEELCAYHLDKPTQLKVKDLSEEQYIEFLALWKTADQYELASIAQKTSEVRSEVALLKDAIKRHFHFPARRLGKRHRTERIELPRVLKEFVERSSSLETAQNDPRLAARSLHD